MPHFGAIDFGMIEAADTDGQGATSVYAGNAVTDSRQAPHRFRRFARFVAATALVGVVAYCAGFFVFLADVSAFRTPTTDRQADGIVVLTGGYSRVDEAVRLLDAKKGERLLISGVHPSASPAVLAKAFAVDEDRFDCCIDIDHEALDTIGNATQTAEWARDNGFSSLLVVTNDYHMPRSLLELGDAMDGIELIPHAVVASQRDPESAEAQADRYRVLFGEYLKYSAARLRTLVTPHAGSSSTFAKASLSPSE